MSKVLLVEDDNNLREIFEMRLQAEGYQTLSASDGEEALVVATKEKPDLMIADIMMPKLSGFEMLENLRAAPEMKDMKVIMMTALGQAEDRARGEKLGVVKYLVKSQVTLEDFVRVVREVLPPGVAKADSTDGADDQKTQINSSTNKVESEQSMQDDNTNPNPSAGEPPAMDPTTSANPVSGGDMGTPTSGQMSTADEQGMVNQQVNDFAAGGGTDQSAPASDPMPSADPAPMGGDSGTMPSTDPMPAPEPPAAPEPSTDGSPMPPTEPKPEDGGPAGPPPTPGM